MQDARCIRYPIYSLQCDTKHKFKPELGMRVSVRTSSRSLPVRSTCQKPPLVSAELTCYAAGASAATTKAINDIATNYHDYAHYPSPFPTSSRNPTMHYPKPSNSKQPLCNM